MTAGEAQKIERIMEKFAERYCRDNPGQFRTADGAYVLSFALIMLNTDAHNPQADKKLSQSDFINMCQDQVGIQQASLSLQSPSVSSCQGMRCHAWALPRSRCPFAGCLDCRRVQPLTGLRSCHACTGQPLYPDEMSTGGGLT